VYVQQVIIEPGRNHAVTHAFSLNYNQATLNANAVLAPGMSFLIYFLPATRSRMHSAKWFVGIRTPLTLSNDVV
jgi:hypothetical protein